jgi:eukaryotic-like serine/threonine-protein kinase
MMVGRFELLRPLGAGGSGMIWRARHKRTGRLVAMKLFRNTAERALPSIHNEIAVVAKLQHPHIATLLDFGTEAITPDLRARLPHVTGDKLSYLVTELASGGDLFGLPAPCPYEAVRDVLHALLLALQHAHARNVLHCDVKPGNILLCTNDDHRPGVMLADFGLARLQELVSHGGGGGTPEYMAPEQFDPDGVLTPASDLYAVGCVAHWLMRGAAPFGGSEWSSLRHAHMFLEPPRIDEVMGAPPGFGPFVNGLLAKAPTDRFRSATHALSSLRSIAGHEDAPPNRLPASLKRLLGMATAEADATTQRRPTSTSRKSLNPTAPHVNAIPRDPLVHRPAPLPATWSRPPVVVGRLLHDAGLALHGVRAVPFVGRIHARDHLWRQLLEVASQPVARAQLHIITGPTGVGKASLLSWFATRAREAGVDVLEVQHHTPAEATDGVLSALAAHLAATTPGKPGTAAQAKAHSDIVFGAGASQANATNVHTDLSQLVSIVGHGTRGHDRSAVALRLLRTWSQTNALVVALHHTDASDETIGLVARLLQQAPDARILIVATATERPAAWANINSDAEVHELPLPPLPRAEHAELCAALTAGNNALAHELLSLTDGTPSLAVGAMNHWVQNGSVAPQADGLGWADVHQPLRLPATTEELCAEQFASLVRAHPQAAPGVVLAAVLGERVVDAEVEMALSSLPMATASVSEAMPHAWQWLLDAGVVVPHDDGVRFAHAAVRAAFASARVQLAGVELHEIQLHRACADALSLLFGRDAGFAAGRIARHLSAAGSLDEVVPVALLAVDAKLADGDVREATALLAHAQRAAHAVGTPHHHAALSMMAARVALASGDYETAHAAAEAACKQALLTDAGLLSQAWRLAGEACVQLGNMQAGADAYERALAAAEASADDLAAALAARGRGDVAYFEGQYAEAERWYRMGAPAIEQAGTAHDLHLLLWSLGYAAMERGRLSEAFSLFHQQLQRSDRAADTVNVVNAHNGLGELARRQRQLDLAMHHYQLGERLAAEGGHVQRWVLRLNQAYVWLLRGDVEQAADIARGLLLGQHFASDRRGQSGAWWLVAIHEAVRGDDEAYDIAENHAMTISLHHFAMEYDLMWLADEASKLASSPERKQRANSYAQRMRAASRP